MPIHFGVDVEAVLATRLNGDLGETLKKYKNEAIGGVFVIPDGELSVVRNQADSNRWKVDNTQSGTIIVRHGDDGDYDGPEGLIKNALQKMQWCSRTGLPSAQAKRNKHRIRPGDFPYGGAGWHMDVFGGVSGLFEESDDFVRELISEAIADIMAKAVEPVIARGADKELRRLGEKYLLPPPS